MSRALLLILTLLLGACGTSTSLPTPEILSVSPNRVLVNERGTVDISLDAVIPVRVNYAREEASSTGARVWIGEVEASLESLEADGTLAARVPEELGPGRYDVRVALADGREAVKPQALTISTPSDDRQGPGEDSLDAGAIPEEVFDAGTLGDWDGGLPLDAGVTEPDDGGPVREGDITGFTIDELGPQQRGQPFWVTIRARGPRARVFQDSVELSLNRKGTVSPTRVGPFDGGVHTVLITVDAKGGNIKLTVTGAYGAQGTSNGFKVL